LHEGMWLAAAVFLLLNFNRLMGSIPELNFDDAIL